MSEYGRFYCVTWIIAAQKLARKFIRIIWREYVHFNSLTSY